MYGIIGNPLAHSWSPGFFAKKFAQLNIDEHYEQFPLGQISELPDLLRRHPQLKGLNVTIPFKEKVLGYLDEIDPEAAAIGAVNCINISDGKTTGFNTDIIGLEKSFGHWLPSPFHGKALILGTGGASKAVAAALTKRQIRFRFVSRKPAPGILSYHQLSDTLIDRHKLIINTTPLGMYPRPGIAPPLPYEVLSGQHFLLDLIYNPVETLFLQYGKKQGAKIKNGEEMLIEQAEASWQIWRKSPGP
ncbi:MAG TPA: shikimate dehydrogenase [Edaphocola sp.]|nr:shikimate dehydrogenase [Edaphocola sp.]